MGLRHSMEERITESSQQDMLGGLFDRQGSDGDVPESLSRALHFRAAPYDSAPTTMGVFDLLEYTVDAFVALDHHDRLTHVNRRAEALIGSSRDELIGKNIWELFSETLC